MILQTPLPNMPPDPGMIIAVFGMMTGVVITGFIALGPVGRAIGDIIRHWLGGGRRDHAALQAGDVDEIVGPAQLRTYLEAAVSMSYQAIGYRRIKNPRIWSLHDLKILSG